MVVVFIFRLLRKVFVSRGFFVLFFICFSLIIFGGFDYFYSYILVLYLLIEDLLRCLGKKGYYLGSIGIDLLGLRFFFYVYIFIFRYDYVFEFCSLGGDSMKLRVIMFVGFFFVISF